MCLKDLFKKLVKGAALHPNFSKMKNILLDFVATGATVSLMTRRTLEESLSTKQESLFPKPYKHMKIMRNFRLEIIEGDTDVDNFHLNGKIYSPCTSKALIHLSLKMDN